MSLDLRWTWAFLDVPADLAEVAVAFWRRVSDTVPSPWRGEADEFTTLAPADGGRAWLKLQRVVEGPGGVHLDLDVDDPAVAADAAVDLGASLVAIEDDVVVLRSPGGFAFCCTPAEPPPHVPRSPAGSARIDQVCLDVPRDRFEQEATFWADLTGWSRGRSGARPEFDWLRRPDRLPVRLLLQRTEVDTGPVTGHLDLACADRAATVGAHVDLGAEVVTEQPFWTVMRDPVGRLYCCTDRDPATGTLPG